MTTRWLRSGQEDLPIRALYTTVAIEAIYGALLSAKTKIERRE